MLLFIHDFIPDILRFFGRSLADDGKIVAHSLEGAVYSNEGVGFHVFFPALPVW